MDKSKGYFMVKLPHSEMLNYHCPSKRLYCGGDGSPKWDGYAETGALLKECAKNIVCYMGSLENLCSLENFVHKNFYVGPSYLFLTTM